MAEDPYKILGISHDASEDQIKSAYRKMAKRYHPDLHPADPQAAAMMNKVNAAYEQIRNGTADGYDEASTAPEGRQYNSANNPYRSRWSDRNGYETYQWRQPDVRPGRVLLVLLVVYILVQLLFGILLGGFGSSERYYSPYGGYYRTYSEEAEQGYDYGRWHYYYGAHGQQDSESHKA